jgi:hypothetical protein
MDRGPGLPSLGESAPLTVSFRHKTKTSAQWHVLLRATPPQTLNRCTKRRVAPVCLHRHKRVHAGAWWIVAPHRIRERVAGVAPVARHAARRSVPRLGIGRAGSMRIASEEGVVLLRKSMARVQEHCRCDKCADRFQIRRHNFVPYPRLGSCDGARESDNAFGDLLVPRERRNPIPINPVVRGGSASRRSEAPQVCRGRATKAHRDRRIALSPQGSGQGPWRATSRPCSRP